jgi:hypothetical protein
MLLPYNLFATVHIPTRVQNESNMAMDSIFIDIHKITNYTISPIYRVYQKEWMDFTGQ